MSTEVRIYLCQGKSCKKKRSEKLVKKAGKVCEKLGLVCTILQTECLNNCKKAPIAVLKPKGALVKKATKKKLKEKLSEFYLLPPSESAT